GGDRLFVDRGSHGHGFGVARRRLRGRHAREDGAQADPAEPTGHSEKRYEYRRPMTHHSGLTPYLTIWPISLREMRMSRSDRSSRRRSSAIARRQADRSRIFDSSQTAGTMIAVRQQERSPASRSDRAGSGGERILLAPMSGEISCRAGGGGCPAG